ncbi:hypothetical protein BLGI_2379 [Brevibacillus laterosporus GI-9]|nr:hypothetical protein BLGI_2379 [Brevibacillus laterosporus GI-9]
MIWISYKGRTDNKTGTDIQHVKERVRKHVDNEMYHCIYKQLQRVF